MLLFLLIISSVIAMAGQTSGETSNEPAEANPYNTAVQQGSALTNSIMHPNSTTLNKWVGMYNKAPRALINPNIIIAEGASFSLLPDLQYTPSQRDQGLCGNCWVWSGTGVLEIALDVQTGIKDRLSIQYFDSNWDNSGGTSYVYTCCGGWLNDVANFYSSTGIAVPWSNTNAAYADSSGDCGSPTVAASSISTSPNYPMTSCVAQAIPNTQGVASSTVITNIKNVLNQNKAVWLGYFLPTQADWNVFFNYWDSQGESVLWSPDYSNGHTWDIGGGGHGVVCVGYNDTDPNNSYWVMLNSWGTAGGLRPDGLFRMNMNMNYNCSFIEYGYPYYSLYWETLNVNFASSKSITITSNPTGSGLIQVDGAAVTTPQTYAWSTGSTHILQALSPVTGGSGVQYVWTSWSDGGAQTHTYTTPLSSQTVTANYKTQYFLTMQPNPSGGGAVSPSSGFYDAVSSVPIQATPATAGEYIFTDWTGSGSGSYSGTNNPASITMTGPITQTANFQGLTGRFVQGSGVTLSSVGLVSDGGEFYLFVRGTSNGIYYQKTTNGSWTGGTWTSLPGATSDVPAAAVVSGTLHLVVRGTDNGIYHNMMNLATGVWTGWTSLPGATSSSPALANSSGTLHIVVRGLDNGIYYGNWTTSSGWNGWYRFSGATDDVPSIAATGTTLNIVVRGTSNGIYYNSKSLSGGTWSGWTSLPGATSSSPTLLASETNRLDLAVRGLDNGVYHNVWTSGSWGTWEALPGATNNKPALTVYDGTLYLAVTGTSNGIYYNKLVLSGGGWTGWTSIPGATSSYPALAASSSSCDIVVQGTDNGIYYASVQ